MRAGFLCTLAATTLLAACSTPHPAETGPPLEPNHPPEPYVRVIHGASNVVQLQIAAREFVPTQRGGPSIWLTGVSHIGEPGYFVALQRHLDAQTLVLFEGISGSTTAKPATGSGEEGAAAGGATEGSKEKMSSLQISMADSLGLTFQLEAIDYRRLNFHNSDLSVQELRDIIAQTGAGESFESLLQMMEGGSWLDTILQMIMRFLSTSPKLQGLSKLTLMDTIGQIQGDPAQMRGLPPQFKQLLDVLIARRNQKVVEDLKSQLERVGSGHSIAVFYGTGHMPDMETRLRREFHYVPSQQIWFTAFSVDMTRTGISETEREFVRNFVQREFEQLQPVAKP